MNIQVIDDKTSDHLSGQREQKSMIRSSLDPKVQLFQFPSSVTNSNHHSSYLVFSALKYCVESDSLMYSGQRSLRTSILADRVTSLFHIALPMPEQLLDKYSHSYGQTQTNVFIEMASKFADDPSLDGLAEAAKVGKSRIVETLTSSDSGTQFTGQRSLQNHVSLYKGTDLRSQTFRYKMRAKNSDELQQIHEIIHRFKRYSAPTLNSKLRRTTDDKMSQSLLTASAEVRQSTVDVPIIWSVAERIKDRYKSRFSDAFVMFPAIITEVSTDYTPNQQWQTVANTAGDPIEVELAVTFREVIPSDAGFMEAVRAASIASNQYN
ncbi:baseplate tail-tube junction protein [Vibrio harveyi]|uniref:baseplate tail-tube junction protein n=1 Tax=Vibrio harveyi TaxID=669 RepID=UPI003CEB621F